MARLLPSIGCALLLPGFAAAADQDQPGRDFPKTLIFDEPGIDDEVSLPTVLVAPGTAGSGRDTELDFELDKRLTTSLSVQVNLGYTMLSRAIVPARDGWQNADATLKYIALSDPGAERLVSVSLIREFGGTGAARIGAGSTGATTAAVNFGQGFSPFAMARLIDPFAITGSAGYLIPDTMHDGAGQQALLSVSLQYSLAVLLPEAGAGRLAFLRPFIPIVECSSMLPVTGRPRRTDTMAPGLIYAGDGFQLAAEALIPLTRSTGTRTGFIAQLNISLRSLAPWLAHPLF